MNVNGERCFYFLFLFYFLLHGFFWVLDVLKFLKLEYHITV
jgi:hypothetical protein